MQPHRIMRGSPVFSSIPRARGKIALASLMATLLAACAGVPTVHTELTTYQQWSQAPADRTFSFRHTPEAQSSLEFQSYEELVRAKLTAAGFREAPPATPSPLIVTLMPSITSRNAVIHEINDPGPIFAPWYWRSAYPISSDIPVTIFQRRLHLEIDDVSVIPGRRLYEGTVSSEGEGDSLARIMPYLVKAMFVNFPGNNGATVKLDIPLQKAAP